MRKKNLLLLWNLLVFKFLQNKQTVLQSHHPQTQQLFPEQNSNLDNQTFPWLPPSPHGRGVGLGGGLYFSKVFNLWGNVGWCGVTHEMCCMHDHTYAHRLYVHVGRGRADVDLIPTAMFSLRYIVVGTLRNTHHTSVRLWLMVSFLFDVGDIIPQSLQSREWQGNCSCWLNMEDHNVCMGADWRPRKSSSMWVQCSDVRKHRWTERHLSIKPKKRQKL